VRRPSLLVLSSLLLTSCVTRQLDRDFATFSADYATDMNWQMLLNLARLDHGHPAYFMAVGEIRLDRNMSAQTQLSGNSTRTTGNVVASAVTNTVSNVLGASIAPGVSASASPKFVFIPLNGEETARQLLAPISIDAFNMLYQQGWPADQLLRVLVERIEVDLRHDDKVESIVLFNSPTRGSPESFARFLRACEIVRELQKAGGLSLIAEERFVPASQAEVAAISAKEMLEAADKSRAWQRTPQGNAWQLGAIRTSYRFRANQEIVDTVLGRFRTQSEPDNSAFIPNLQAVIESTVTTDHQDPAAPRGTPTRSVLILRSFRSMLEAVAQEQRAMAQLVNDADFTRLVPPRQLRPVLRTDWGDAKQEFAAPAIALTYAQRNYQITDPVAGGPESLEHRWNRDVFRLLVQLSSQVTVDITKFQRQVLELTQ